MPSGSSNDQVPLDRLIECESKSLKINLNTFLRVVCESIEGSKMVEDLNQEEYSTDFDSSGRASYSLESFA